MYTYIIIDDESLIRKGTIKKIERVRQDVSCIAEASEGAEGIALIEQLRPDFAIIDMQMPGMNGTELLPHLAEHYPDMPLIVISGYQNFDYLKHAFSADAVDYLLKPFSREAIGGCVEKALLKLENSNIISRQIMDSREQKEAACYEYDIQYLTNLILGFYTGDGTITSEKLKFINTTHQIVLLTLYFSKQPSELGIHDWLEERGYKELALYLSNSAQPQTGFLILFLPHNKTVKSEHTIRHITDALLALANQHDCPLLIGISRTHSGLMELNDAFLETSSALNQQKLDDPSLCSYIYSDDTTPRHIVWDQEDKFLFYLEAGRQENVRSLTEQLFGLFQSIPSFTLNDAKYYCYYLSEQCKNILNYYLEQKNTKPSGSMQNIVSRLFRIEELKDYYMQFFLNMAEMLRPKSIYGQDDVIENVKIYMRHNYQKNLTQDFIASLFYLNRSYLSTLFKQRTGVKFIDYLNDIRIEKAAELLRNSDRKMYHISKAVGYDNPKYFFRIFKKKKGCSPEQYRNENGAI